MSQPTPLTDRAALERNRRRARSQPVTFLHDLIADEIEDRLSEVNKSFSKVAVVTGHDAVWRDRIPGAQMVADSETLDLPEAGCDLIVHHMGLHWSPDIVGQLVQARRALQPDGLFLATFFGGETLQELRRSLAEAEIAETGGLSPRVAPMAEIRDAGGLLQRAGFALPVADSATYPVSYANVFDLMRDLRGMGEANALSARLRQPTRRGVFARAAALYEQHFQGSDGRLSATFEVITLTGWAPADNQPKPLRPGSAKMRLAEALGTSETTLDSSSDRKAT